MGFIKTSLMSQFEFNRERRQEAEFCLEVSAESPTIIFTLYLLVEDITIDLSAH